MWPRFARFTPINPDGGPHEVFHVLLVSSVLAPAAFALESDDPAFGCLK
ncbi:hypothetical protein ACFL2H_07350 [Planctomycetota bacterium]